MTTLIKSWSVRYSPEPEYVSVHDRRLFGSLRWMLGIALLWSVAACSFEETVTWQEEVLLHDGKTIVVTRTATIGGGRMEPGASNVGETNFTLSFTAPNGQEVFWENPRTLRPLVLGFEGSTTYLATRPAMGSDYMTFGCPDPAYVFLKYQNGWQRVKYEDFPKTLSKTNLLVSHKIIYQGSHEQLLRSNDVEKANRRIGKDDKNIDSNNHGPDFCFQRPSQYNNFHHNK